MGLFSKANSSGDDGDAIGRYQGLVRIKSDSPALGVPQLLTATARCGRCGTSTVISGRPGTMIYTFTCRSCTTQNVCNDNGFTFESRN